VKNTTTAFVVRTRTEEVSSMSTPDNGPTGKPGVKTLAIRLEPDVHAQLSLIAQLRGSTITDEFRKAIEAHIASVKGNTDLASKADNALEDIEREATTRREAIATLFGTTEAPEATGSRRSGQRGKEAPSGS
jgi:predicted DNA-binding protein